MVRPSVLALSLFALFFLLASVLSIADQSSVSEAKPAIEVVEAADCEVFHSPVKAQSSGLKSYIIN